MATVSEFFDDLREHWNDGYWWADRPLTLAILLSIFTGILGVGFAYLEGRARKAALA